MSAAADGLAAIDAELAALADERAELAAAIDRYNSPPEREARRAARVRYAGEVLLSMPLRADWLRLLRAHAERSGEGWLFGDAELAADSVEVAPPD